MKLSQHKFIFGMLHYVVFMLILVVYILPGFLSHILPWKQENLFSRKNNRKIPVKMTNTGNTGEDINFCSNLHDNRTWFPIDHGILLLNKTIYYCGVPKCGSTFMGMFLIKLLSKEKGENSIFQVQRGVNISNIYSFMFVREPYGRILSAYQNKLFNPSPLFAKLGTDVVKEVRENPSELSLRLGHDVTFTELIQYIVKFYNQGRTLNPHITAIHTLCHPCRQKYDFIGKLETMTTDLVHLVNEWKTRGLLSKEMKSAEEVESEIQNGSHFGPVSHMFSFYYQNRDLISKYKLFQRTWASYQIRGKILKDYKLPFNESNVETVNIEEYKEVLKTALAFSKEHKSKLKEQRREALQQIYGTVPVILLEKLSQYLKTDCELFLYENRPGWIFNESEWTPISEHNYFEWL